MIQQHANPANYAEGTPVQPFNPQTFADGTPVPWSMNNAEGSGVVLAPNQQYLTADQAADFSKMTGSAKLVLAGSSITSAGVIVGTVTSATVYGIAVGAIIAAVGAVVGFAGKLFGNKWHASTGVRWLVQKYQYYVLGASDVTSDNKVNEDLTQPAFTWFQAVLGVPVYDKFRYHVLNGTDPNTGRKYSPATTYAARADAYLQFWDAQEAQVTREQAIVAARIADNLQEYMSDGSRTLPGYWSDMPIAPSWFQKISPEDLAKLADNDMTNDADVFKNTDSPFGSLTSGNKLPIIIGIIALIAIATVIYFYSRKKI